MAHKIAKFITDNDRKPRSFLQVGQTTRRREGREAREALVEDPAGGLFEGGVLGAKECRRILSTWMAKCTFGTAGGDKNLPGGEDKKPVFMR